MISKEEVLQEVIIKFAGDSGDGMQLTGSQFTNNTALLGLDLATFRISPAEYVLRRYITRVSGYQLRFSSDRILHQEMNTMYWLPWMRCTKGNLKALKKGAGSSEHWWFDAKNLRLATPWWC